MSAMIGRGREISLMMGLVVLAAGSAWGGEEVLREAEPGWVEPVEMPAARGSGADAGAARFLVSDMQYNLASRESYYHFAIEVLTAAGVEDYSQIDVSYRPQYQDLVLHGIEVHRAGGVRDRLAGAEVEVIRREQGMEDQLYDGKLTALVILEDVRPGDVIEYGYTLRGGNPVFDGQVHRFHQLQYSNPTGKLVRRILWDEAEHELEWRWHEFEEPGEVLGKAGSLAELRVERDDVPRLETESDTPGWFDPFPWLEISSYRSWAEYGDWAFGVYGGGRKLPGELVEICEGFRAAGESEDEQVCGALRWVQGNIRYLGSFLGEHSHAPYPLEDVWRRRFGDCKDKASLLTAMLRHLGFDAAPAMVHTGERKAVVRYLPGPACFDHLIVHLRWRGEDHWLDPTATYQRGELAELHTPDYGWAFVVREGETGLRELKPRGFEVDGTEVTERFHLAGREEPVELWVKTVATGGDANRLRYEFAGSSLDEMESAYLEFYASDYQGIEVASGLRFADDPERNRVQIDEHYRINELWQPAEGGDAAGEYTALFYAGMMAGALSDPPNGVRRTPFRIAYPNRLRQKIVVDLFEDWPIDPWDEVFEDEAFVFHSRLRGSTRHFELDYEYQSRADAVAAERLPEFRRTLDKVGQELAYELSWSEADGAIGELDQHKAGRAFDGIVLLGIAAGLVVGLLLAVPMFLWNPKAREPLAGPRGISGWLVLVAIGMVVAPLIFLGDLVASLPELREDAVILLAMEDSAGWVFLYFWFAFVDVMSGLVAIMLAVLFFCRRSSVPWLYVAEGVFGVGLTLAGFVITRVLFDAEDFDSWSMLEDAPLEVLHVAVWGLYMVVSIRVRNTFVVRRGHKPLPPLSEPPPLTGR